jgi:hypothetical protein
MIINQNIGYEIQLIKKFEVNQYPKTTNHQILCRYR